MKIALISCSKRKQSYRCQARELYAPSQLFSLSYAYAKRCADRVYILSAKYGLLEETDMVAPYDLTLAQLPPGRQLDWANYVLGQLGARCDLEQDEFIILAGKNYYQHLMPHLAHASLPLGRLSIGPRIEFLQRQLSAPPARAAEGEGATAEELCLRLHRLMNALPRYTWQDIGKLPFQNGIYIVFEQGESYRGLPRVVRVGTHTAAGRLKPRLTDHFVVEDREGSIFRKNVGKAILNRDHDPYLKVWAGKEPGFDGEKERRVEGQVSDHLRRNVTFTAFPVETKEGRLRLEEGIIATLHRAPDFGPGSGWLGRFSPEPEICQSGLWLKQGLNGQPLSQAELELLEHLAAPAQTGGTPAPAAREAAAPSPGPVGTVQIRQYILEKLRAAQASGLAECTLVSGQLHKELGLKNRMPPVCSAMRQVMGPEDVELPTTAKSGYSSTIRVRYRLTEREL